MLTMFKEKVPAVVGKAVQDDIPVVHRGNQLYFISLGCPRNLVDSEVMLGILLQAGYEVAQELEEADYIIINTCGFLEASREESLDNIEAAVEDRKPGAKVVVTGCMVQNHSEEILDAHPEVDYLLGSGDVEGILKAVEAAEQGQAITSARSYLEAGNIPRQISTPKHYAYLKIAEGCRKRCAYCTIPDIKGPLKSKGEERILKEFQALLDQGVKEVILIAQDLGDWGKDQGYKRTEGLLHLLKKLSQVEGDHWIRLLYLYPDEITEELVLLMKADPRICPYLDMPIQHVNDEVLQRMHRATNRKQVVQTIEMLRKEIPQVTIRTSLIVGFPGETEEQFQELEAFLSEYALDNVGVFQYSQEKGSRAAEYPDQIEEDVKQQRYHRLMEIQKGVVEKKLEERVGTTLPVIVEGFHPESELLMQGRHPGQCPEIDGVVIINDGEAVETFGERYEVEITAVAGYDLVGKAVRRL